MHGRHLCLNPFMNQVYFYELMLCIKARLAIKSVLIPL